MNDAPGSRLADRIYGQIIAMIIDQALVEGDKLPGEEALARRFGVSRPVIRESLSRLNSDGLIATRPGSGSYLRTRPAERLVQYLPGEALAPAISIFEVRSVLEPAAAALAAQRRTPEQLAALDRHFEEIRVAALTKAPAQESDHAFHCVIMEATNNDFFTQTYAAIADVIVRGMSAGLALSRGGEAPVTDVEEHAAILRAIRARDEKAAELAMRWHLWQSRQRLIGRSGAVSSR